MDGHSRKLAVVACYLPPNYKKSRGDEALSFITDTVIEIKRRYSNPYIVVAGDFNQWKLEEALSDGQGGQKDD